MFDLVKVLGDISSNTNKNASKNSYLRDSELLNYLLRKGLNIFMKQQLIQTLEHHTMLYSSILKLLEAKLLKEIKFSRTSKIDI